MKTTLAQKLLHLLLCGGLLATAGLAQAHGDRGDRDWNKPRHSQAHRHAHEHGHSAWNDRRMVRERLMVHQGPGHYRETVVHRHYHAPAHRPYAYRHSPALVIGVDIPPLVIPLR